MNRAEVVEITDELRRFPGVRNATARDRDPNGPGDARAWMVTFAVNADDLGREAAELIRLAAQEMPLIHCRELSAGGGLVVYALRGLAESRPAELAAALGRAGRRLFEHMRGH